MLALVKQHLAVGCDLFHRHEVVHFEPPIPGSIEDESERRVADEVVTVPVRVFYLDLDAVVLRGIPCFSDGICALHHRILGYGPGCDGGAPE